MTDGASHTAALERELAELRAALGAAESRLKSAVRQARSDEARSRQFAAIFEASRDAIWSWTPDGAVTSWNAAAERLLQYAPTDIVGKSLLTLVPPERLELARGAMENLRKGEWYGQYETVRLRKNGAPVQVELTVSPILDDHGVIVGAATICRDITERKQLEAQQELLRLELDHRVKNTLATVHALMQQIERSSESKETFVAAFGDRLRALVRIHDSLIAKQFAGARLRDLIEGELSAFTSTGDQVVTLEGGDVVLDWKPAQMVCLAVHELARNAARHGALSVRGGAVRIAWTLEEGSAAPRVTLVWLEQGGPPVKSSPARRGFGLSLLERGLVSALGGTAMLDFAPGGLRYKLSFPIDRKLVTKDHAVSLRVS